MYKYEILVILSDGEIMTLNRFYPNDWEMQDDILAEFSKAKTVRPLKKWRV